MELQEKPKGSYYHVIAGDKEISRHRSLATAKKRADAIQGSAVYTDEGVQVYPESNRDKVHSSIVQKPKQDARTAVLKVRMNVRKGPSLKAEIIRTMSAGETVEVSEMIGGTENNDSWMRIRVGNDDAYILYSDGKYAELRE